MTHVVVLERLQVILQREFGCEPAPSPELHLQRDLMLDALDLVDLLFFIRLEFGVEPPREIFMRTQRLGELVRLIGEVASHAA